MPDVIEIGFGLSGYELKKKDQGSNVENDPSVGEGAAIGWDDEALDDGKWLRNEKLKQGVMHVCVFQSVPVEIKDEKTEYICAIDEQNEISNGKLSFGGATCVKLSANKNQLDEKLDELESFNGYYEANRKDFVCGVSVHPSFVREYMNHFFNIDLTTEKHIYPLMKQHLLNVEILFSTGEMGAKARHFKVVHSEESGDNTVIKIMSSVLMTKNFNDIITFNSNTYGIFGSEKINFPYASNDYNYKKASINGFSPSAIKSITLPKFEKSPITLNDLIKWKSASADTVRPTVRVRFFADSGMKDTVKQIIPNCPDEFFKTNYNDNESVTISPSVDLSDYKSVSAAIFAKAQEISDWVQNNSNHPGYKFTYTVGGGAHNSSQVATYLSDYTLNGKPFKYEPVGPQWTMCCGSFVWWVLSELGVTKGAATGAKASAMNESNIGSQLNANFKAKSIGPNIDLALPGDILVFGIGASHTAIYHKYDGGRIWEYGMGATKYMNGDVKGSHSGRTTQPLKDIIRIVQANDSVEIPGADTNTIA